MASHGPSTVSSMDVRTVRTLPTNSPPRVHTLGLQDKEKTSHAPLIPELTKDRIRNKEAAHTIDRANLLVPSVTTQQEIPMLRKYPYLQGLIKGVSMLFVRLHVLDDDALLVHELSQEVVADVYVL